MAMNGLNAEGATVPVIALAMVGDTGFFIPQQEMHTQAVAADITAVADPHVAGQLWKNAGVITISAG